VSELPSVTAFQVDVARTFFALPEAESFLLAGGLALLAQGMSERPTQDMDAFTSQPGDVQRARTAFEEAAQAQGWVVHVRQSTETFVRLHVVGQDSLLVDLALDSPPGLPASISVLGPTFDPDELAARKLLALFDRAMPRDFVDVYAVTRTRSPHDVLALARELDPGLDTAFLLVAMRRLNAYRDEDVPIDAGHAAAMREFFEGWVGQLDQDAR
jgi:hypothetical protein